MRTISEIKGIITSDFMNNEAIASIYGFTRGDSFSVHFSKVSVESILFYIFACAAWVVYAAWDAFKAEVLALIEALQPHRPKWYRDKVLGFMKDCALITDTDRFDTYGMGDDQIAAAQVIKNAWADENDDASILTIKIAGEQGGNRCRLDDATEVQVSAYIKRFKDAGVRISLVNVDPDAFDCEVDIYYDAILQSDTVKTACRTAIEGYIENLPFNGEYTNMALVDALQVVSGVKVVEFRSAKTAQAGDSAKTTINGCHVPYAGYFKAGDIIINMKPHA